jgi:hypothetical protein
MFYSAFIHKPQQLVRIYFLSADFIVKFVHNEITR